MINAHENKREIHIGIVKLAKELGVDFAFPSTTVMIEQFPEKKPIELNYNKEEKRMDDAIKKVVDDFKTSMETKEDA